MGIPIGNINIRKIRQTRFGAQNYLVQVADGSIKIAHTAFMETAARLKSNDILFGA